MRDCVSNAFFTKLGPIAFFGLLLAACQGDDGSTRSSSGAGKYDGEMVLAISWQPAFCENARRKRECRSQTATRYDATHFALHGLWPQSRSNIYCGVSAEQERLDKSGKWSRLDIARLPQDLWDRLRITMPGTQSGLHRHEWVKHGTCYSADAETYYEDSLALMDAINASSVQALFAGAIGTRLTNAQVRNGFDAAFGKGVGDRVRLSCRRDGNRQLIVEMTLGLKGVIEASVANPPDIAALALAALPTDPGCPGGTIDPAGFQ